MKTKLLLLFSLLYLTVNAQIPMDYVARYDFVNGDKTNLADPGNGDLTGNIASSQLRDDRFGNPANAIRVNAVKYSGYTFTGTNNNISISFWIQGGAPSSGGQRILQVFDGNGDGFDMHTASSNRLQARFVNGGPRSTQTTNSSLYNGSWNHIVYTIQKTGSGYNNTVYINGVENADLSGNLNSSSTANFLTSNARFFISPLSPNGGSYFGQIDDVRIYNRALTATEALALKNEGTSTAYTLTTNVVGNGTITVNPTSNNGSYASGQAVVLTATPSTGHTFTGWSGDITDTSLQTTVIMDSDKTITANFTPDCIVNVPDSVFLNVLLNHSPVIDTNGDNQIQCSEASAFTGNLIFAGKGVSDVTGIEKFVNITRISGWNNNLTSINLSNNTKLNQILLSINKITDIDISMLPLVTDFKAHTNELTQLNLANGNNSSFTRMEAQDNNNLTCIQIDNGFTPSGWNSGGVSYSTSCYVLSNDGFELNTLKVYPNPTVSMLNVDSNTSILKLEVYNLLGKKVLESKSDAVNVSNLSQGMYILKVENNAGVTTKRFIKQ